MTTVDDEKRMQEYMNEYYLQRGYNYRRSVSCKRYDLYLSKNGYEYRIEEKFNFTGRIYDKMIVEIVQDLLTADLGWFYSIDCDYLYWLYCPEDRISRPNILYTIDWPHFKYYVFSQMIPGWHRVHINNLGYGLTLNMQINLDDIIGEGIANKYEMSQLALWNTGI